MMHIISIAFLVILSLINAKITAAGAATSTCDALSFLHSCEANGYDKFTPPELLVSGGATTVKLQIYLESMGQYDKDSSLTDFDFYFVQFWSDTRLKHTHTDVLQYNSNDVLNKIWQPDMYFANAVSSELNEVMGSNMVLKITPSGSVRVSTRVHLQVPCKKIDECTLKIVSYGYTKDKMNAVWLEKDPIQLGPEIPQGEIYARRTEAKGCSGAYFGLDFNCLTANFQFGRNGRNATKH